MQNFLLPQSSAALERGHRDAGRTRKRFVKDPPKASGGIAKAESLCAGTEWESVRRALGGDPDALARLFAENRGRFYRIALSILRNREDAEDALQDALLSAYLNLRSFQGRSRFSTWLTRIVFNTSLINLRRLLARPQMPLEVLEEGKEKLLSTQVVDAGPNPEEAFHQIENKHAVQQAMNRLLPRLRSALHLRDIRGFSIEEAAKWERTTVTVMKSRSFRARRRLASVLDARDVNL